MYLYFNCGGVISNTLPLQHLIASAAGENGCSLHWLCQNN